MRILFSPTRENPHYSQSEQLNPTTCNLFASLMFHFYLFVCGKRAKDLSTRSIQKTAHCNGKKMLLKSFEDVNFSTDLAFCQCAARMRYGDDAFYTQMTLVRLINCSHLNYHCHICRHLDKFVREHTNKKPLEYGYYTSDTVQSERHEWNKKIISLFVNFHLMLISALISFRTDPSVDSSTSCNITTTHDKVAFRSSVKEHADIHNRFNWLFSENLIESSLLLIPTR